MGPMEAPPLDAAALAELVAIVQTMVNESGNPVGFDAHAWTVDWVTHPVPALGMRCPLEYMQTQAGLAIVRTLLLQIQSGAYS